ncbi:hypothetical protein BJX70DRAFT_352158 [Aspergillus crustosus]
MSFLDSVLSSIETGKPNPIPPTSSATSPTISSSTTIPAARRPNPVVRPVSVERKNGAPAGTKRKAEEPLPRTQKPLPQISARPTTIRTASTTASSTPRSSTPTTTKPSKSSTSSNAPVARKTPPVASSKPPPKGSYADLMARAKAAQQHAPTQVGMLKHQPAPKEKLSKVERRKRLMEARAKEKEAKLGKKSGPSASTSTSVRPGNTKTGGGKRDNDESTYKGTARPAPSAFEYRGTAGLPSRNGDKRRQLKSNKRSRMDEYLGTDEEDEGESAGDHEDYYSESSDMEAGLYDVEEEEKAALAAARREDEEDIRREAAAKQEKLERRKKLAMLASKRQ